MTSTSIRLYGIWPETVSVWTFRTEIAESAGRRLLSHRIAKAYYSALPEFVGRDVWVRWDGRLVRLFNDKWEQVAVHVRAQPGKFRTDNNHIPKKRVSCIERGANVMLKELALVGPSVIDWSEAMLQARGVEGIRVLQGLTRCFNPCCRELGSKTCACGHSCWVWIQVVNGVVLSPRSSLTSISETHKPHPATIEERNVEP